MATPKHPRRDVKLGVVGERARRRLKELRDHRDLSLKALSELLDDDEKHLGHPMSPDSLSKIETGKRRIDLDDLVALAAALDVTPLVFLLPDTERSADPVELTPNLTVPAQVAWDWARVRHDQSLVPMPKDDDGQAVWDLRVRSLPPWAQLIPLSTPFGRKLRAARNEQWRMTGFVDEEDQDD